MKNKSHLIKKHITVTRGGRSYTTTVWVLPDAPPTKKHKILTKLLGLPAKALKDFVKRTKQVLGHGAPLDLHTTEVKHVLDKTEIAFISAGKNPNLEHEMTHGEQVARSKKLHADLVRLGYKFTPVAGHYGGVEDSFMVMVHGAKDEKHIIALGTKYNQDSVLISNHKQNALIYTTGVNKGKRHTGTGWQLAPAAKDFYTKLETAEGDIIKFSMKLNKAIS